MKQFKLIPILFVLLFLSIAFANTVVRGGMRGGNVSLGLAQPAELSWSEWATSYGAEVTAGTPTVMGYLSFNKIIGEAAPEVPVYFSFGPAVVVSTVLNVGAFAHLGFDKIFGNPNLFGEIGIDAMAPKSSGVCIELGYRF